MAMQIFLIVFLTLMTDGARSCGLTTHIEIAHRATKDFKETRGNVDYKQLILDNQDAFQAGNPYPDAYYDTICQGGKFHSVSEDTHWTPFLTATIDYIRQYYPKPWNEDAKKLVVFLLGFASHQVADVSWHSLGIDQGFLTTMGDINFFGSFPDAHSVGDVGGDILAQAELELEYISTLTKWYVPVKDLFEIYKAYYNNTVVMEESVIVECTALLFLERLGEKLALAKLYDDYSAKSPFMVEQFEDYFLGGVDDMATWTQNVWHDTISMLEDGTSVCDVPHNPIYITCSGSEPSMPRDGQAPFRGLRRKPNLRGLDARDVKITDTGKGVIFTPSEAVKCKVMSALREGKKPAPKQNATTLAASSEPTTTLHVTTPYARLGWSVHVAAAHLHGDEDEVLIIGAPGYGREGEAQLGRVYAIYGSKQRFQNGSHDLDEEADMVLEGFRRGGKFGSAVTALDLNLDGFTDIVVSAPSVGAEHLTYSGEVYIFYGTKTGAVNSWPSVTISCTLKYCNLGWSLSVGDVNEDGHFDLLVGSPFAPANGQNQAGMVSVLYAGSNFKDAHGVQLTEKNMNLTYSGNQEYGWYGAKVVLRTKPGVQMPLVISQPTFRRCAIPDCSYSTSDTQSVGTLKVHTKPLDPVYSIRVEGKDAFEKLGAGVAVGDPWGNGSLILASGSNTKDVQGIFADFPMKFTEAGMVYLLNMTTIPMDVVSRYEGDRNFGRFGGEIMFADVTGDGIDDLVVSAPFRTEDVTEELFRVEEGAVYVYPGGPSFGLGNVTSQCSQPTFIKPCPAQKAYAVFSSGEAGSRFGSKLASWSTNKRTRLVVSAPRSSEVGRLAGQVYIYSTEK